MSKRSSANDLAKGKKKPARKRRPPSGQPHATVVLTAGAPNSPLMGGALAAIYERGKTFDNVYTSGAGGLIGLLFVAPKDLEAPKMLESLVFAGIEEPLYSLFPVPFKTFFKPGPWTIPLQRWARAFQVPARPLDPASSGARLYNDLVDFYCAAVTPSTLTFFSKGLCRPLPGLDAIVDWHKLRAFNGELFLNAFNISRACMYNFDKNQLDERHFHAALACPFIYPPQRLNGDDYCEGADVDPVNLPTLEALVSVNRIDPGTVVLMDILGSMERALVRVPRNLLNAYSISLFTPVVALAKLHLKLFEQKYAVGDPPFELKKMDFDVPKDAWPHVLDWSYKNISRMWELGFKAGHKFCDRHGHLLPDREVGSASPQS